MSLKIVSRSLPKIGRGYGPPGDGPFPAVLLLHGSEGKWSGWTHNQAAILAAHGFLAIPFGYSNGGNYWNAGDIKDVPLDPPMRSLRCVRTSCRAIKSASTARHAAVNMPCCSSR